jgi:hypothetical protein
MQPLQRAPPSHHSYSAELHAAATASTTFPSQLQCQAPCSRYSEHHLPITATGVPLQEGMGVRGSCQGHPAYDGLGAAASDVRLHSYGSRPTCLGGGNRPLPGHLAPMCAPEGDGCPATQAPCAAALQVGSLSSRYLLATVAPVGGNLQAQSRVAAVCTFSWGLGFFGTRQS